MIPNPLPPLGLRPKAEIETIQYIFNQYYFGIVQCPCNKMAAMANVLSEY